MTMGTPIEANPRETCRRSCSGINKTPAVPKMLPMMTLWDSHAMAPILGARGSLGAADSTPVSACNKALSCRSQLRAGSGGVLQLVGCLANCHGHSIFRHLTRGTRTPACAEGTEKTGAGDRNRTQAGS